ncbi:MULTISPECIES: hypothetical protein [Streptomyces]|uniref:PqqD family protein n=2 Tax=Streptomyces TaxID=1883 RepID=A0A101QDB9_STRCK|nr:hypothetical protein [Streptomyces corchorusii]ALO91617.1 hypothetical protein SHL15_0414 [Streptomyces hygroscopicus subsp. limoneus]KUN27859.1 hypothetical protein AQJ11_14725 [Streptomyces corchorusii]QGA70097.1 hypothetical protein [Streptomyces sp.]
MVTRPDQELTARVRPDGYLELFSRRTGKRHRCGPRGTTMWLALQRSGWQPESAADEIALQLGVDPASIRCDIHAWLAHFREAGE